VTYILRQLLIIMSYVWVQDHYTIIPSPVASIPLLRNQVSCTQFGPFPIIHARSV